ncbi:MAG: serpin family protein, partial [Raoultibacter sp.]
MKRQVIIAGTIACLLGAAVLAACSSGGTQGPAGEQTGTDTYAVAMPAFPEKTTEDNPEAWLKVLDENPLDQAYLDSLPAFSYKTAAAVFAQSDAESAGESMNGTYSPISLYYALALATQGAAGKTAEEMNTMLGAPDPAAVPKESGNLFRVLSSDPYSTIDLANSIWMSKSDDFEQSFVDVATQQFYATPFAVEFGTAETDKAIAAWISANTNGTIDPEVQTEASQIMSIINTVYFKGSWADQFDAANTKQKTFRSTAGDVQADFMTQRLASPSEVVKTDTSTR